MLAMTSAPRPCSAVRLRCECANTRGIRGCCGSELDESRRPSVEGIQRHRRAGVDISCREVQIVWDELFADKKTLAATSELGIASDALQLAKLVPRRELPPLLATLTRTGLAKDYDAVRNKRRAALKASPIATLLPTAVRPACARHDTFNCRKMSALAALSCSAAMSMS
jgi:hypothetical protein